MYVALPRKRASQTGARLVHACGFDSIPYDLGVQFTVEQLPENVPIKVDGLVRAGGRPSGGTFAHRAHRVLPPEAEPRRRTAPVAAAEPRPGGPHGRLRAGQIHRQRASGPYRCRPSTRRSSPTRRGCSTSYGPDFRYSHYAAVKRLPMVAGGIGTVGLLVTAAQVPPARNALLSRLKPGDGPSAERRAKSWFNVRFVGEGGGKQVITEVAGGDPGYDETAKMLAESALCLSPSTTSR